MSAQARAEPGSFRDPSGRVFTRDGRVFRCITPAGAEAYQAVAKTGALQKLVDAGLLIDTWEVSAAEAGVDGSGAVIVLEHRPIPFISYPYEWSFSQLKAAALLHLRLQRKALALGVHLSDASAYNVQFIGPRPVFIDALSLVPYEEGAYWDAYTSFCEHFLNPLLLKAKLGVDFHDMYRGALNGIRTTDLDALLPWHKKCAPKMLLHVAMQARMTRAANRARPGTEEALKRAKRRPFSRAALEAMLESLESWIKSLNPPAAADTLWGDYEATLTYSSEEETAKRRIVGEFVQAVKPGMLWDIGCNAGAYSALALESGAKTVVGFDFDEGALECAWRRANDRNLSFLPLRLDAANPSPNQGWDQCERKGITERGPADALVALAVIHHLAIGRNVPLGMVVDWLTRLSPRGLVEFVPIDDPTVKMMLTNRRNIFTDYTPEAFERELSRVATIDGRDVVSRSGRTLYRYSPKA